MLARTTLALFSLAAGLVAQSDYELDKRTSARLGGNLDLQVSGAPAAQILLFLVSSNAGPTPLSLLDPTDLRVLQVGTDLLGSLTVAVTGAAGDANYSLPLPSTPSLANIVFHWQTVTLALGASFFGEISNSVVTQTGIADTPGLLAPNNLLTGRAFATGFADRDNNAGAGDFVIAGGGSGTLTGATGLASTELWDFRRMRVIPGANMTTARALHQAVRLADNRVLLIGGADATGATLNSCEIYDPATNTFTATGNMGTPRVLHAAVRLADGRVMVAGGTATLQPDVVAAISATLATVEIWSPLTGTWSSGASLGAARLAPALTRLPNNQIMVSGGVQVGFLLGFPFSAVSTPTVQRWTPTTAQWTSGPNMPQGPRRPPRQPGHAGRRPRADDRWCAGAEPAERRRRRADRRRRRLQPDHQHLGDVQHADRARAAHGDAARRRPRHRRRRRPGHADRAGVDRQRRRVLAGDQQLDVGAVADPGRARATSPNCCPTARWCCSAARVRAPRSTRSRRCASERRGGVKQHRPAAAPTYDAGDGPAHSPPLDLDAGVRADRDRDRRPRRQPQTDARRAARSSRVRPPVAAW